MESLIRQAVDNCQPDQLLDAILNSCVKIENDKNNAILLGKIKEVVSKVAPVINNRLTQIQRAETSSIAQQAGETIAKFEDVSFVEPRGKFNCTISATGIHLNGKQMSCFLPLNLISHLALVPNNTSTKKEGEDLLTIRLSEPIKANGKDLRLAVWVLSKATKAPLEGEAPSVSESAKVTAMIEGLCPGIRLVKPRMELFRSMKTQKSYLGCYHGIQEGVLHLLDSGLLFLKPLIFIPLEDIEQMTAGRGGTSNTRFVDLVVNTRDGKKTEFTNFEREELGGLQMYVTWLLKQSKKLAERAAEVKTEVKSESKADGSEESDDEDDKKPAGYFDGEEDSEEDDDDYCPDSGSSDGDDSGSSGDDSDDDSGSAYSDDSEDGSMDDEDDDDEDENVGDKRKKGNDSATDSDDDDRGNKRSKDA